MKIAILFFSLIMSLFGTLAVAMVTKEANSNSYLSLQGFERNEFILLTAINNEIANSGQLELLSNQLENTGTSHPLDDNEVKIELLKIYLSKGQLDQKVGKLINELPKSSQLELLNTMEKHQNLNRTFELLSLVKSQTLRDKQVTKIMLQIKTLDLSQLNKIIELSSPVLSNRIIESYFQSEIGNIRTEKDAHFLIGKLKDIGSSHYNDDDETRLRIKAIWEKNLTQRQAKN